MNECNIGPKVYLYLEATWGKKEKLQRGLLLTFYKSKRNMLSYSSYTVVVLTEALGMGALFLRGYLDLFRDIFVVAIGSMLLTFSGYRLCLDSG